MPSSFADFDLAHDAINSYEQGSRGGMYSVQSGDTLAGIASALWGDASLWYKIAEVNGLTAESPLIEGMALIVPAGVQSNANNASTFQPYDPLEVLGASMTRLRAYGDTHARQDLMQSRRPARACVSPAPLPPILQQPRLLAFPVAILGGFAFVVRLLALGQRPSLAAPRR